MATAAATAVSPRAPAKYDRVFYSSMGIVMALTVLIGFGPTYYMKAFNNTPMSTLSGGPMTLLVQMHGVLFTAWMLLFIVQTALVAQHKVAIHRRIGIAGALLAASMVVVGTLTALKMAARGAAPGPSGSSDWHSSLFSSGPSTISSVAIVCIRPTCGGEECYSSPCLYGSSCQGRTHGSLLRRASSVWCPEQQAG